MKLLDIRGDVISHTSDYFETIYNYAIQLIKDGKAYADDTEQLQVRDTTNIGYTFSNRLVDARRAWKGYSFKA